jgi:hypothetical protein
MKLVALVRVFTDIIRFFSQKVKLLLFLSNMYQEKIAQIIVKTPKAPRVIMLPNTTPKITVPNIRNPPSIFLLLQSPIAQ